VTPATSSFIGNDVWKFANPQTLSRMLTTSSHAPPGFIGDGEAQKASPRKREIKKFGHGGGA
jgi:hypothetical protein